MEEAEFKVGISEAPSFELKAVLTINSSIVCRPDKCSINFERLGYYRVVKYS